MHESVVRASKTRWDWGWLRHVAFPKMDNLFVGGHEQCTSHQCAAHQVKFWYPSQSVCHRNQWRNVRSNEMKWVCLKHRVTQKSMVDRCVIIFLIGMAIVWRSTIFRHTQIIGTSSWNLEMTAMESMEINTCYRRVPSGKLTVCYGKSLFLMGKSAISMAIFNSKLLVYQRVIAYNWQINKSTAPLVSSLAINFSNSFAVASSNETRMAIDSPRWRGVDWSWGHLP